MSTPVRIIEVGPRDGLQNEPTIISTADKLDFIAALIEAGCREIEVASFVHPKLVPAMADAAEVVAGLPPTPPHGVFWSLVPNGKGYLRAEEAGARAVAVFAAASETFSQKNIGRSIADSLEEYERVVTLARADGCRVRGYVSTITHCPYEGRISPEVVLSVAERLLAMGCEEVSLGETLGRAEPADIDTLLTQLLPTLPVEKLAGHFHDTGGHAIENVSVALNHGLRAFDSSAAGLGGCPFAPGAAGNVATETLVRFLESQGYSTGIDAGEIAEAGQRLRGLLSSSPSPTFEKSEA
ncbi:MAG: hydroxymethylglutaryl-CoA lyase [Armatimonas sp.]